MRLIFLSLAAAAAALVSGCKPPPPELIEQRFRSELKLHFNTLNQEALARKESLRKERAQAEENPALKAPSGTIYSTYTWDEAGFIVENFKCRICEVKLLLPFPSAEYLCRSCGHCPYSSGHSSSAAELKKSPCAKCIDAKGFPKEPVEAQKKETFLALNSEGVGVKDMFEVTKVDKEKGIIRANVRYVRRVWVFDGKATVSVSQKAVERGLSDTSFIPSGNASEDLGDKYRKYQVAGFHRPDTMYVGEMEFEMKGSTMTLLRGPKEEPVRQWTDILGNKK